MSVYWNTFKKTKHTRGVGVIAALGSVLCTRFQLLPDQSIRLLNTTTCLVVVLSEAVCV